MSDLYTGVTQTTPTKFALTLTKETKASKIDRKANSKCTSSTIMDNRDQ